MSKTPLLELPLNIEGHVAMQNTVKEGFKKIDERVEKRKPLPVRNPVQSQISLCPSPVTSET